LVALALNAHTLWLLTESEAKLVIVPNGTSLSLVSRTLLLWASAGAAVSTKSANAQKPIQG